MEHNTERTMERPETSQSEGTQKVCLDAAHHLLNAIETHLTKEQWQLLRSGEPDDATKLILDKLLSEVIVRLSNAMAEVLKDQLEVASEEGLSSNLAATLCQSFSDLVSPEDQCASLEHLANLIVSEVTEHVKSISIDECTEEPVINHVTSPCRLQDMLDHIVSLLKVLRVKVKCFCTSRRKKTSQTSSTESVVDQDQSSVTLLQQQASEMSLSMDFEEIINQELVQITQLLLEDLPDTDYDLLEQHMTLEIEKIADDIIQLMNDDDDEYFLESGIVDDSVSTSRCMSFLQELGQKIRIFFTRQFAKVCLHRIAAHIKAKFPHDSSTESVKKLIKNVDSLLLDEAHEYGAHEFCIFWKYKKMFSGKAVTFTKEVSDLLYRHVTSGGGAETAQVPVKSNETQETQADRLTAAEARRRGDADRVTAAGVRRRAEVVAVETQTESQPPELVAVEIEEDSQLPEVVTVNINPAVAPGAVSAHEDTPAEPVQAAEEPENRRMFIREVIKRLVSKIFSKVKVNPCVLDTDVIINHLAERAWAEVKSDLDITPEKCKNLHNAIYKDLHKKWGCAEKLLIAMVLKEPQVENCIVSSLTRHLKKPKKSSTICCFFSSVGRALTNIFKPRNKVVPI